MNGDRYLIDTNIFILLFNNRLADTLPDGQLACSFITEIELLSFPSLDPEEENIIQNQLAAFTIYGIDSGIKKESIRLRRHYRIKLPDAIIAATALVYDAVLLTNDRDFRVIGRLNCQEMSLKP